MPIVEVQLVDMVTLMMDSVVNQARILEAATVDDRGCSRRW